MIVPILFGFMQLGGCVSASTQNVRFYTLQSAAANSPTPSNQAPVYIELQPIKMPEYLKRPQIVTRTTGSNQVNILEQSRWASPFNNELQDALNATITQQTHAVVASPVSQQISSQALRLTVTLQQLNAYPNDHISANFSWTLSRIGLNADTRNISCQFTADEPLNPGVEGVIKGMQLIVQKLATQISGQIKQLNDDRTLPGC